MNELGNVGCRVIGRLKGIERKVSFRLEGEGHSSRGQRPRKNASEEEFCPARASQNSPSFRAYAAIIACSERSYHFLNQGTKSVVDGRHSATTLGLSIPHSPKSGMQLDNDWRRERSRTHPLQSFQKVCPSESARISQKGFVEIHKDTRHKPCGIPLAGRVWAFQHQSVTLSNRTRIHSETGRTPQERNISAGILAYSRKISNGIRRTLLVGLKRGWNALSGRENSLIRLPRALPSATMGKAFSLDVIDCRGCRLRPPVVRAANLGLIPPAISLRISDNAII
jgi:hypothetical protein